MKSSSLLLCLLAVGVSWAVAITPVRATSWRPVALMHGLLASKEAMSHAAKWIEADYPGIHIHNVEVGDGKDDSLFMDINDQVVAFAKSIQSDPMLTNGFNLIAHSQGGLLARAYVERFNDPPVHNLITWAGPHAGQYGVPDFNIPWLDKEFSKLLDSTSISPLIQRTLSFAAYWKNPYNYSSYLEDNIFLADINNERAVKNATYKAHIEGLNKLLLVDSSVDTIVIPNSSPWFQFFALNQSTVVTPLRQSEQYTENWLGLKTLDTSDRLQLRTTNCSHQNLPRDVCKYWYDLYTKPLLNNTIAASTQLW